MMHASRLLTILLVLLLPELARAQNAPKEDTQNPAPPFTRLPVMRAPTPGNLATPVPFADDRVGAQTDLFDAPEPPTSRKPSCILARDIRAAKVLDDSNIRLTLRRKTQVDMKLRGTCFGLAFDEMFYYQPGPTGQLCARADVIVARSGSRCLIEAFVPVAAAKK
jgi:hypothetical protein